MTLQKRVSEMHNWQDSDNPEQIYFSESEQLKKLNISDDAWNKTKDTLEENCEASDIINFLKLDTTTEEMGVQ